MTDQPAFQVGRVGLEEQVPPRARLSPPEVGASIHESNARVWGGRRLCVYLPALERLLVTDERAPRLLDSLVHRSLVQRSGGVVDVLKACLQGNPGINQVIQFVGPGLKDDRLERLVLARDGDQPGVEIDSEVILREAPAGRSRY